MGMFSNSRFYQAQPSSSRDITFRMKAGHDYNTALVVFPTTKCLLCGSTLPQLHNHQDDEKSQLLTEVRLYWSLYRLIDPSLANSVTS
ncbi:hypothetical protein TNIN_273231 [Trichonephila inaurata madagascariensis]|uniref:Uncharacterized protein n=1 Tax=Trichonephila inaurata madagascariensis TaxID=2747483 RepID=A0A8X6JNR5_9ARAC|nr:hypothetical protein TNIN_273231 [Trichonephila inaurata madagascariensis]